ncbi:MAG: ROK family protein [Actinomycetota bacterium]|nr:ROK family protein [Actinomycetota bacterium]
MAIGIDVGGTKCLGLLLDRSGSVVAERRVPTPVGSAAIVDAIAQLVQELAGAGPERGPAEGVTIGVGAPGLVNVDGVLRVAPNLPGVEELGLRADLEHRFPGSRVRIENDASCAGWAEREAGAARGADHAVLVTLGTGIGGGIIVDGDLLRGAHGFAAEVGHMVVDPDGPPCPCGRRGCWERFASGSGLRRLAGEVAQGRPESRMVELAGGDAENVRGEHVTTAAGEGDEAALEVMSRFAWWLALGLANLANVFDPDVIVVGGGLVAAGELLLEPARAAFAGLVLAAAHRPQVGIVPAALGERAGAMGAALLASDER